MNRRSVRDIADIDYPRAGICYLASITAGAVASALIGGVAASMIGGMMQPDAPQVAAPPAVKPPTPMPVAPGASQKAKAEKTLAQQMAMTRASTVLTGDESKLG